MFGDSARVYLQIEDGVSPNFNVAIYSSSDIETHRSAWPSFQVQTDHVTPVAKDPGPRMSTLIFFTFSFDLA